MTAEQRKGPLPKGFPWGRIQDVHVVGTYALIEYKSTRPGNAEPGWTSELMFAAYVHRPSSKRSDTRGWTDIGQSFHSLEAGLVGCIAWAAGHGGAVHYFMKMIAPEAPLLQADVATGKVTKVREQRLEDALGVSSAELQKAINELRDQGQGTALDLPAAILLRLRDRINVEE